MAIFRDPPEASSGGISTTDNSARAKCSACTKDLLGTLQRRLPTRRELVPVAGLCVTVIYGWSIVAALEKIPSWSMFLNAWDIAGILAYAWVLAFVESMLLLSVMVALALALPTLFAQEFVAQSALLVLLLIAWAVFVYSHPWLALPTVLLLAPGAGLMILVSRGLLRRHRRFRSYIVDITQRAVVFLYLYLPIAILALLIVLIRNVR